ncbi:MAG: Fic family protein, partial [Spirochaetia bacterium]
DQVSDQVSDQATDQAGISLRGTAQVTAQATEQVVTEFCRTPRTRQEVMDHIGMKHNHYFRRTILNPMLEAGILKMTIPNTPNSPKQKYYTAHTQGEDSHE